MAAVLVVEDERLVAHDIEESLRKMGYDVVGTASTADECLRQAEERRPDLVLMDIRIDGELDGIETAKELRARFDIPIIYLTAYADQQTVARACETEPHGYLLKPFRAGELRSAVEIALSKHQKETLRARLALAERLTSLGTLAAGVAHEINNPLTYILGNAALTRKDVDFLRRALEERKQSSDELLETIGARLDAMSDAMLEIEDGAERVRKIVGDLQVFARPETGAASGDVRAALEWALRVTDKQTRERAQVVTRFAQVPPVRGSGARLGQVFVNLLLNAAHAIAEGQPEANTITVKTELDPTGRVVVSIEDTGHGMSSEVQKRIFEPFFTTKPVGSGTGLGLSICHGIIQALGGDIQVESKPGVGTKFHVRLPLADPPKDSRNEVPLGSVHGRVLVIDDEPQVARTMQRMLRGHDVQTVHGVRDALELLAKDRAFDLIFCDLTMPELTGMDFYDRLQVGFPELVERVVFVSGGVFTQRAADFLAAVPNLRLPKPFSPAELRRFVDDFLRDHPSLD